MSASGQGDSNVEVGKEDDSEITSTTTDNGGSAVTAIETTKTVSEAVSAAADSTEEPVASKYKDPLEAINETDGAIDSNVATASIDAKDIPESIEAKVICGDTSIPSIKDEVTSHQECSKGTEPDLCSSKDMDDADAHSTSDELVLKWDDDDNIDETIPTAEEQGQDYQNNEYNKTSEANSTAQLIEKAVFVTDESKLDTDGNKSNKIESNQTIEGKSSDNIKDEDQILSHKDDSSKDDILPSINEDNKVDDEMASTSFESQDIIDKIDNIAQDKEMSKDIGVPCTEEPIDLIDTDIPDEKMDIDKITTDPAKDNVVSDEVETMLQSSKEEEKNDIEVVLEAPLKTIDIQLNEIDSFKRDTEKSSENESSILKEKEMASTSFESQDIIDKIDDITQDKEMSKDIGIPCTEELFDLIDTDIPDQKMDIDTTTTDPTVDNVSDEVETKLQSSKEEENIDTKVVSGAALKTFDDKVNEIDSLKRDTEKSSENESAILKEMDVKVGSVDKKDDSEKSDSKSIKDSVGNDSKLGTITPNIHHRINKPNVMLDIPTNIDLLQELSDMDDDDLDYEADSVEKTGGDKKVENSAVSEVIDIDMQEKKSNTEIDTKETVTVTSPTIVIDATSSKINIKTVSSKSEELKATEELRTKSSDETSTLKLEQSIDDEKPPELIETSNLTPEVDEKGLSAELIKSEKIESTGEGKPKLHVDDEKPSTSQAMLETLIPDADSVQEVSDSLGLLAESSRVMDDDNDDDDIGVDADDQDGDDNDDEDFYPYEETNSDIAEDMDSNSPPPDSLSKLEKPDKSGRESDEDTTDAPESIMDVVDDMDCVETDIIDADLHVAKQECPPDKIINIIEKVLGPQITTGPKLKDFQAENNIRSYVELAGSSDSDDESEAPGPSTVSISDELTVKSKVGQLNEEVTEPPPKVTKPNPDKLTIKVADISSAETMQVPVSLIGTIKLDEVFSLDSDDDDDKKNKKEIMKTEETKTEEKSEEFKVLKESPKEKPQIELSKAEKKCINPSCTSETQTYYPVDRTTAAYYSLTRRRAFVCDQCKKKASDRSEALINGIKKFCPLMELDMDAPSQQLVEISDSDSDGEGGDDTDRVGERGARFLEEHLADMINETWKKYKMESRLKETEISILSELDKMEANAKEINAMLDECQKKTDNIRFNFYKNYELRRKNVGAIVIHDTPFSSYSHVEKDVEHVDASSSRYPKRRASSAAADTPAKKPAIPLGYTPLGGDRMAGDRWKTEDDKDISVVKLSAESAPPELPPPGEVVRPPLAAGMTILAMRNAFGTWLKGKIMDVQAKAPGQQFTQCRVKFEHKVKNPCKVLAGRCLAYPEPSKVRLTIGTRVVALFKDPHNPARRDALYSGVVAEIPNPVNSYRYLVFFDDGYAQYVHHQDTRIVCESSHLVWEEVHPFIRDFIYKYLLSYPERPMVRLHAGEKLKTEWNGKWWDSKVLKVDASIALISFDEDNRTEWIYRGSTRLAPLYLELQAARAGEGKGRSRLPRSKAQMRSNMPCVEYTRSDEQAAARESQQQNEEMRRQRAVAKKSTTPSVLPPTVSSGVNLEGLSRVVYYTPKNAVKPYKMTAHTCTVHCRRTDVLTMKDLRTYNPLAKPLLSGWERHTVRYKALKEVVYRAPCGRRLRNMPELHKYLRIIQSDMSVDMFDFTPGTHCLAEFVLNRCNVSKKDLSHGKENVPVPCVNYYDDSLPEFCSYNTERTPTAGVPLNLDPEFLCGCDCTDDCQDKTKCACWKMTLEGARTIGLEGPNVGYVYRRLPEPLPSGIYECNSRCKCKQTCLNRVAQHPLQLKLQVFKTSNRGWGIRALNDVPKGSFLCIYAGNLLTDATANLDGLNEGDEYLAELDYIEVVEAMKEGYEDDVPEEDKKLDSKESSASESETSSESDDEKDHTKKDGDFQPGYIGHTNVEFKKSLRKREKAKKKEEKKQEEAKKEEIKRKEDCITISDDEEVREPSRFTAEAGMVDKGLITKQSSRVSVRSLYGKDEACYIMDAKVQGNIGRYLNHSCHPNVFVQNVFVDTHDPRFPWVAFFALSHVKAGTELTWNYNYDVGSVPEKVLYCYCGAPNCRGRLL